MDLTEISREQAAIDLEIANTRILELSVAIRGAGEKLEQLRDQLARQKINTLPEPKPSALTLESPDAPKAPLMEQLKRLVGLRPRLLFSVDEVCGRAPVLSKNGARAIVTRNEFRFCTLQGWALPEKGSSPLVALEAVVNGKTGQVRRAVTFQMREDVARHFGNPALVRAGFLVNIPMSELVPGTYEIEMVGRIGSGDEARAHVLEVEIR